jgi:carbon-monoxide dehydrogenase medium subunit
MKPAPLDYEAPTLLSEAITMLSDPDRDVVVLAGGQSLVPMLNLRLARPDLVVDLRHVPGLDHIRLDGDRLVIGAMTTKRAVERSPLVQEHHPLLHAATLQVGHPQIRNRGTVGGSMAHADPAAEYPAVAVASAAEMHIVGPAGERTVPAEEFFLGYFTTALDQGDILTEVRFPLLRSGHGTSAGTKAGWAFCELSRRHGDFAMVGAALTLGIDHAHNLHDTNLVVFGVGATPLPMRHVAQIVDGHAPDADLFAQASRAVADAIDSPLADVHASAEYRRHLAAVLTVRAFEEAVARATEAP